MRLVDPWLAWNPAEHNKKAVVSFEILEALPMIPENLVEELVEEHVDLLVNGSQKSW